MILINSILTVLTVLSASTYAVGKGAPHHPPAGMHLQRGEFLAYSYLHMALDAIHTLRKDMESKTNAEMSTGNPLIIYNLLVCVIYNTLSNVLSYDRLERGKEMNIEQEREGEILQRRGRQKLHNPQIDYLYSTPFT